MNDLPNQLKCIATVFDSRLDNAETLLDAAATIIAQTELIVILNEQIQQFPVDDSYKVLSQSTCDAARKFAYGITRPITPFNHRLPELEPGELV